MVVAGVVVVFLGIVAPTRTMTLLAVGIGSFLIHPLLAVVVVAGAFGASRVHSIRRQRRQQRRATSDVLLALDLMALAATSGLPFTRTVMVASRSVGASTGDLLDRAVRRLDAGLSPAIDDGLLASAFDAAQRSVVTGASLAETLAGIAQRAREDEATRVHERLEKLPVKLLFPMAFLILPGFVLVAVVPTIVSGLSQLTR
jgi:tight adherence protein C